MQGYIKVRRRLDAVGLTCSMIMTALRKPGQMQGYIQVRCSGSNLLHDHDSIEEARSDAGLHTG